MMIFSKHFRVVSEIPHPYRHKRLLSDFHEAKYFKAGDVTAARPGVLPFPLHHFS
jgi:hypothetical protein